MENSKELDTEKILEWLNHVKDGTLTPEDILPNFKDVYDRLQHEVCQRREQILDINQWTGIIMNHSDYNGITLRPKVLRSMIGDINNRTTD